jgi:hypothetical protein
MTATPGKSRPQVPLALYVIHHPKCEIAATLAGHLYEWFRLGYQTGDTGSVSVPFWIRCQLNTTKETDEHVELEPEIDFEAARLNIVILLSSHEMVLDPAWRRALLKLQMRVAGSREQQSQQTGAAAAGESSPVPTQIELLPAVLDDSFYNLTPIYEKHNPLRLTQFESADAKVSVLRRAVLEMTARTLYNKFRDGQGMFSELRVFLSHAKKDGTGIAEQLRDAIRRFGQLIPWYDANDLAVSQDWTQTLDDAMQATTAGMIAVVTDTYPTRPWCRKELKTARTPLDLIKASADKAVGSRVFALQPVVAVMHLENTWTRGLGTLEGVPRIGWLPTQPLQSVEGIVDRFVLELMLHQVRRQKALSMAAEALDPAVWFITWVPDGWTLAMLAKEFNTGTVSSEGAAPAGTKPHTIVYPGVELSPAEKEDLDIHLQLFGPDTRLLSFQEWEEHRLRQVEERAKASNRSQPSRRLLIALSAGGDPLELSQYGLRSEHIDETMVRIVMRVLSAGHRLAFGGTLNNPDHPLTRKMIDTTLRWVNLKAQTGQDIRSHDYLNQPSQWPLVNYSAYPFYNDLGAKQEAAWIGFCNILRVDPKIALTAADRSLNSSVLPLRRDLAKLNADALLCMRETSTRDSDLRIVWGGKIKKAMGWMPGILEEVGCSLQQQKPVLILGALGGCARLIADFLRNSAATWPEEDLCSQSCADPSRDAWLTTEERNALQKRVQRYRTGLEEYRAALHGSAESILGVNTSLLLRALDPDLGTTDILYHVERFIQEVQQSKSESSTATKS